MMSRFRSFIVHLGCGHCISGTGPSPGMPFFILLTCSPTQLRKQVSQKRWEQLVITGLMITKVQMGHTNWLLAPSASSCVGRMRRRPCPSSTSEARRPGSSGSGAFRCRAGVGDMSTFSMPPSLFCASVDAEVSVGSGGQPAAPVVAAGFGGGGGGTAAAGVATAIFSTGGFSVAVAPSEAVSEAGAPAGAADPGPTTAPAPGPGPGPGPGGGPG
mmetsp:Transcript_87478/g.283230  ORF Transcript_87478/g.283230 Transcript_87478/m.283230 type:complete len:215 (+) Transcript_87478:342-986(+)